MTKTMHSLNSLFNKVWLSQRENDTFIVKEYTASADIGSIKNGQKIAALFKERSIPAVLASAFGLKKEHYFQEFPYIKGRILTRQEIKVEQVKIIARLLQKMHEIKLDIGFAPDLEPYSITFEDWQSFSKTFDLDLDFLKKIHTDCLKACSVTPSDIVISHRDVTLGNVIWQNEQAYIIDWDWAGKISQAQDVLATALNWSLKEDATIDQNLLQAFLEAYELPLNENEWKLAKYRVLANWLNWVALNIEYYLKAGGLADFRTKLEANIDYSLNAACHCNKLSIKAS